VSEAWAVEAARPLMTVRAVDKDDDSAVMYRFSGRTAEQYGQLFNVDRHTGLVTLTRSVDYEHIRSQPRILCRSVKQLLSSPARREMREATSIKYFGRVIA